MFGAEMMVKNWDYKNLTREREGAATGCGQRLKKINFNPVKFRPC